jgi:hypothetical protein
MRHVVGQKIGRVIAVAAGIGLGVWLGSVLPAVAQTASPEIFFVYTKFNAEKGCKHTRGRDVEDYGSWRCAGHDGIMVLLSAGDQRMTMSFGKTAKQAGQEKASSETFPGFNSVYDGTIEWRIEKLANGKQRPFATIVRWNTRTEADGERDDGKSTGRTFVVTRLGPNGVCHVGYVDARQPGANEAARKLADEKARTFKCGTDDPKK